MILNPEKMEELKQKYDITAEAITDIANALELDSETPEPTPMGRGKAPEAYPDSLTRAMKGELTIAEVLMYKDVMNREDDRRERRSEPPSSKDTPGMKDLIDEMREERRAHQEQIEKLILGKRADDAEERAKRAEEDLKKKEETDRQREIVEGAVRGAVGEMDQKYGAQLDALANRIHSLPVNQQTSFMDELFSEFGTSLKDEFKATILNRLKPPEKPLTKTDEEGKSSIDWNSMLERGFNLADKYVETQGKPPPKLQIKEIPPTLGGSPVPLAESSSKPVEGPPPEAPAVATSPIPPQDLTGIGPERAKKLSELGINDARQLTKVSPNYLKDQLGVGKDKAEEIIKQAKELTEQA